MAPKACGAECLWRRMLVAPNAYDAKKSVPNTPAPNACGAESSRAERSCSVKNRTTHPTRASTRHSLTHLFISA